MLTRIEVRSPGGSLLTLPLENVVTGFVVESITGLDPVKATLVSTSFANLDGAQYHSARREARNITMRLLIEPDYATNTVEELRHYLYGVFMPKSSVNLRFVMSNGLALDIDGIVESCETPLFTKTPAVDISLMCFNPAFYDTTPVVLAGSTTSTMTPITINYPGTIAHGGALVMNVNHTISEFTLHHRGQDNVVHTMLVVSEFLANDVITISTVSGAKSATMIRTAYLSSILHAVSPQSAWFELMPGNNEFYVHADGATMPYTLTYTVQYGGL